MSEDYRGKAFACLRLARELADPKHKAELIEMAHAWLRLHDEAEQADQANLDPAMPPRRAGVPQQQQQQQQQQDPADPEEGEKTD